MAISQLLSYSETLLSVVAAAVAVHLIFKRTETHEPVAVVFLLIVVPSTLTTLYAPHASSISRAISATFSLFWASLAGSILLYRASPWHPLSKYPGPLLCRLTKFYIAYISLGGKQHIYYMQLHEMYGDVVRVGPNELSIRDANAVVPLFGPSGLPKGPFWEGRVPEQESTKPLIALRDKHEHSRRRRPWNKAFSTAALKGYETIVAKRCFQLVEALTSQTGVVNFAQWVSYFTYDVMNDLAFGGGSEMIRDGDIHGLWHLLEAGQKNAMFMSQVPWLGALFLRSPNFAKDLKAFRAHARGRALLRNQQGSPHKDIFYHLMDEDGLAAQPPSTAEVTSDGGLAIIAGSDTTSSVLTNLFYFLMSNPTSHKRLQDEIDGLGDDLMNSAKQANLPYLNGCLSECMRLLPPILSGSQRAPEEGSGGKAIGSYFIPEGSSVFIPTYALQRDSKCFSLPDAFLPERWLQEDQRMALEPKIFGARNEPFIHNSNAFVPFSLGAANCAGKSLAWMELRQVVCLLVQKLDFKFADGYESEKWYGGIQDYFVAMKGELPTVVTPRKQARDLVYASL